MPESTSSSQFTSRLRALIASFLAGSVITFTVSVVVWNMSVDTEVPESLTGDAASVSLNEEPVDASTRARPSGSMPHEVSPLASLTEVLQMKSAFSQTTALQKLIEHLDVNQLDRVLTELDRSASPIFRDTLKFIVYRRYVEVDPARALDGIREETSTPNASDLLAYASAAWARIDYEAATEYARSTQGLAREEMAGAILKARSDLSVLEQIGFAEEFGIEAVGSSLLVKMAQTDPKNAWNEALVKTTTDAQRHEALSQIARLWAEKEPEAALQAISETLESSPELRRLMLGEAISQMAATDPEAAVALALRQPESEDRDAMLTSAFSQWGMVSREDALAAASSVRPPELGERLAQSVYSDWAVEDPYAVLDIRTSIPNSIRGDVVNQALYQIGSEEPESVLELAPSVLNLSGAYNSGPVVRALSSLSESDLDRAMRWIDQNMKGQAKSRYIQANLVNTARDDPKKAFDYALTMPSTPEDSPEFSVVLGMLIATDTTMQAKNFVPQIRDATRRSEAFGLLAGELVASDPKDAIAYGRTIGESEQPAYYESAFRWWARSNLDQATSSISQVPNGIARDRALSSLVTSTNALNRSEDWVRRQYDRIDDDAVRSTTAAILAQHYGEVDEPELAEQYQRDVDPNLNGDTLIR